MPRRPRSLVAGGVYHVTSRGVRRSPLFHREEGCRRFLRTFAEVVSGLRWRSLAWCLMPNHFHLLVLTPEPDLPVGMHALKADFATWFNRAHGTSGHVFERRFHDEPVVRDSHLLETARYIANNPVRAGLCADPAAWRWSSHRAALGLEPPTVLDVPALHARFGADGGDGRRRYADFVGGQTHAITAHRSPTGPLVASRPSLVDLLTTASDADAIADASLAGYSQKAIAAQLGVSQASVSRRLKGRIGPGPIR